MREPSQIGSRVCGVWVELWHWNRSRNKKSRKPVHLTISAWLQGLISLEEDSWNNETVNYNWTQVTLFRQTICPSAGWRYVSKKQSVASLQALLFSVPFWIVCIWFNGNLLSTHLISFSVFRPFILYLRETISPHQDLVLFLSLSFKSFLLSLS